MALGNVGYYLTNQYDEINTFLSRDGGLTWKEVKKGAYIFEFGDHGSIIVMAELGIATTNLHFSWNEGKEFEELEISEGKPVEVTNIVIEPKSISQEFIMYGAYKSDPFGAGVVMALDFRDLHEPQCKGADNPGGSGSDYELWTPHDGRHGGQQCSMGKKVSYIRRKQESECYNGETLEREIFVENCICTEEDFECDYGYKRSEFGVCESTKTVTFDPPQYCPSGEYYSVSKGYRQVPGNTCQFGVDHAPMVFPCPGTESLFMMILKYIVVLGLVGAGGFYCYVRFVEGTESP
jgi:hypothetical protein